MKAVFLDRDGVINELVYHAEAGIVDSPFTLEQFHLLPGVGTAIAKLNQAGFKVFVVSNQPGIAKEHFTMNTLRRIDSRMTAALKAENAHLDGIYYCPHHPEGKVTEYRVKCDCRKPEPGLLLQAARDCCLDLRQCYLVGDNLSDIEAGQRAGCRSLLVGRTKCELCRMMEEQGLTPAAIVSSLSEAVTTILEWEAKGGNIHRLRQPAGNQPVVELWRY